MKKLLVLVALAFGAGSVLAGEKALFGQGQVSVESFVGAATSDLKHYEGLYGLGMSYSYHPNWSVGARVLHSGFDLGGMLVDDVQGRLTGRLALKELTRLAPYVYVGAGYRTGWPGEKGRDNLHLDAGAGLEWRFTARMGAFVEAGWNANFNGRNSYVGSSGVRWTF